jgi:hypothetical protein
MRSIHPVTIRHRAAAVCLLLLAVGLLGCPSNEDFPTALDLVAPPTPNNFVITDSGPNPQGGHDYDLSWTISDATDVDHYRVYLLELGTAPELVAETTNTSLPATLPFQITGLQMGVSAVSTGNVEGHYTSAVAP